MAISIRQPPYRETENLIERWQNEPVLWDTGTANYMNSDYHRAAMQRISAHMDGIGVGK
jgi:hypothetical protein